MSDILAVVLFVRWFLSLSAARQSNFSRDALSLLIRCTVLLYLVLLPVCLFSALIIWLWPIGVLLSVSLALLMIPLLLGFALFLSLVGAAGIVASLLIPRWPVFRCIYFLPGDADLVRIRGVKQGILAAASAYPEQAFVDGDEVDTFVRSNAALLKVQTFPANRPWRYRLTNDFSHYCNCLSDGYLRGYQQFYSDCQTDSECLAEIRARFAVLTSSDDDDILHSYVTRYLQV